ncbi:MAG: hypothetical protein H5T80_15895 [Dietzia sp.]|nr:hypothetical protein [Dietzia sp.]
MIECVLHRLRSVGSGEEGAHLGIEAEVSSHLLDEPRPDGLAAPLAPRYDRLERQRAGELSFRGARGRRWLVEGEASSAAAIRRVSRSFPPVALTPSLLAAPGLISSKNGRVDGAPFH